MSKSKSKQKADVMEAVENMPVTSETVTETTKARPGRPIEPGSKRQIQLLTKGKNEGKRGRPADPNSINFQKRQAELARKADPNYVPMKGRPVDPNSPRQKALKEKAERAAKRAEAAKMIEVTLSKESTVAENVS